MIEQLIEMSRGFSQDINDWARMFFRFKLLDRLQSHLKNSQTNGTITYYLTHLSPMNNNLGRAGAARPSAIHSESMMTT
jgi:hypothetical protein